MDSPCSAVEPAALAAFRSPASLSAIFVMFEQTSLSKHGPRDCSRDNFTSSQVTVLSVLMPQSKRLEKQNDTPHIVVSWQLPNAMSEGRG
jgi:hypothetical protein